MFAETLFLLVPLLSSFYYYYYYYYIFSLHHLLVPPSLFTTNVCRRATIYTAATRETYLVYQENPFTV